MAGKNTKPKKTSSIGKAYLRTYNFIQTIGWSYILYKLVTNDFTSTEEANLWHNVKVPIHVFQNAALLEIIHAATGLVPSNPILTAFQVASRVMVVCGVLSATPESVAASSLGLPLAIFAWSVTEIIRYSYYFFHLFGFVPSFLTWVRYSFFTALYPIGITGELLCIYAAAQYASAHPEAWSYALPNEWNFTFSYHYLLIIVMLLYIPLFPKLYMHMFSQRRKILGTGDSHKKAH